MAKRIAPRRSTTETTAKTPAPTAKPVAAASDRKPRSRKPAFIQPTDENVRLAAYYRYLERAESPGDALGDWIEAERSLKRR